jgi:hypothetical protein
VSAAPRIDQHQQPEVLDMVAELVDARRYRERIQRDPDQHGTRVTTWHRSRVPSLLDQLDDAAPGGDRAPSAAGYESKPAARIDAVDTLDTIDRGASRWLNRYDVDHGTWTTADAVRHLGVLLVRIDRAGHRCARSSPRIDRVSQAVTCCTWHELAREVRRWWARARIVTGWDEPAWRPDARCPVCGTLGSLGVRLRERIATCVECHEGWDPSSYQELADHVRAETLERAAAGRPMPCKRVPGYDPPVVPATAVRPATALVQCRACGSARCQRAIASRLDEVSL